MKILFLSQRFLIPLDTGGKIRTANILKHLSKKHHITLISNFDPSVDEQFVCQIKSLCAQFIAVSRKKVRKYSFRFFIRLFFQMFSLYPVSVLNDYSVKLRNHIEKEYSRGIYDLAICDFVQSALLFKKLKETPKVLFQHNVESTILKRHAKKAKNKIEKLFWYLQWKKMVRFEKRACNCFDKVIAVSGHDKKKFETMYGLDNVNSISTGVDVNYFKPMPHIQEKKYSLVFCGSMDWLPNEDAMIYFIKDVFPLVKKEIMEASLCIVGRNPSKYLKKMVHEYSGIKLTGWVEDIRPYIAEGSIVIVPIRIGGGTRIKIYEAMAMGKPVISTSIGAEGLPVSDGENILIVDNPIKTAELIVKLFHDQATRKKIGKNAMTFVRENFSWEHVAFEFNIYCKETIATSNGDIRI